MNTNKKKLSVVIPAYNETEHINESIVRIIQELKKLPYDREIIIINDGSIDDTKQKLIKLKESQPEIRIISYATNRGKGHAIKRGLLKASGDIIVLTDADLDIHPRQIRDYVLKLEEAQKTDNTIVGVIGSKLDKDSDVHFPLKRRIMSYGYYLILKTLFRLDTKDTNTGLKVYNSKIIKNIAPKLVSQGYAYDIEILSMIYKKNHRVLSMPVCCKYSRNDTTKRITFSHAFKVFNETMTVFRNNIAN